MVEKMANQEYMGFENLCHEAWVRFELDIVVEFLNREHLYPRYNIQLYIDTHFPIWFQAKVMEYVCYY